MCCCFSDIESYISGAWSRWSSSNTLYFTAIHSWNWGKRQITVDAVILSSTLRSWILVAWTHFTVAIKPGDFWGRRSSCSAWEGDVLGIFYHNFWFRRMSDLWVCYDGRANKIILETNVKQLQLMSKMTIIIYFIKNVWCMCIQVWLFVINVSYFTRLETWLGFGKLFPKNHLLFYSFILRYWAHYSFKRSPLFSTRNTLCAVLSCVQYKNGVKFLI